MEALPEIAFTLVVGATFLGSLFNGNHRSSTTTFDPNPLGFPGFTADNWPKTSAHDPNDRPTLTLDDYLKTFPAGDPNDPLSQLLNGPHITIGKSICPPEKLGGFGEGLNKPTWRDYVHFSQNGDPDYGYGVGAQQPSQELIDLNKQLASQQQLGESGIIIAGKGSLKNTPLRDASRLANDYGGNPQDWVKKSSTSYKPKDKTHVETHWYENIMTGEKVEPKTKIVP